MDPPLVRYRHLGEEGALNFHVNVKMRQFLDMGEGRGSPATKYFTTDEKIYVNEMAPKYLENFESDSLDLKTYIYTLISICYCTWFRYYNKILIFANSGSHFGGHI